MEQENLVRVIQERILHNILTEAKGSITHRVLSKTLHKRGYELAAGFLKERMDAKYAGTKLPRRDYDVENDLLRYAYHISHAMFLDKIDPATLVKVYKGLGYPTYDDLKEAIDQYPQIDGDGYTVRDYTEIHPHSVMDINISESGVLVHTSRGHFIVSESDTDEFHEWLDRCINNIHRLHHQKKKAHLMGLL